MALVENSYTPLSLVDCREFRKLISSLDPQIVPVLRYCLSIKLIPLNHETTQSYVISDINNCPYVVLSFDLWMYVKNEIFFKTSPSLRVTKQQGTTTLACPAQRAQIQITFLNISLTSLLSLIWRKYFFASPVIVELI